MTFKDILDAVIKGTFDDGLDRADAKNWVNARYSMLWDHADWSFAENSASVTVTAGSSNVTNLPADFLVARGLQRSDSTPLIPIYLLQDFKRLYVGTGNTATGLPEAYTVISPTLIQVGPQSSVTDANYILTYQQSFTPLVNDGDVPAFPVGYHMALVFGAKAEGAVLKSVLLADPFEARWNEYLAAMMGKYISSMDAAGRQPPAYRAEAYTGGY